MAAITAAVSYQHAYDVVGSVGGNSRMAAILLPVVPFSLEMYALRRLTTAAFGTLMCLEPALALVAGFALLGQVPRAWSLADTQRFQRNGGASTFFANASAANALASSKRPTRPYASTTFP